MRIYGYEFARYLPSQADQQSSTNFNMCLCSILRAPEIASSSSDRWGWKAPVSRAIQTDNSMPAERAASSNDRHACRRTYWMPVAKIVAQNGRAVSQACFYLLLLGKGPGEEPLPVKHGISRCSKVPAPMAADAVEAAQLSRLHGDLDGVESWPEHVEPVSRPRNARGI